MAVAVTVFWFVMSPRPRAFAQLIGLTAVIGFAWDSGVALLGLMRYAPGVITPPLAPLWILALWILLATTLHLSMRWLQERLFVAAALGAIAAPLSYLAGARLGALTLPQVEPALLVQAVGWAVLLPVLLRAARGLNV